MVGDNADIRSLIEDRLADRRAGQLFQRNVRLWVKQQIVGQQLREKSAGGDGIGQNTQMAGIARGKLCHIPP